MKSNFKMKLPRAHARGIFPQRFVGSEIPPKRKTLRVHPQAHARGFSRRGINKIIRLAISYVLVTTIGFKLPYINLYTFDFQWRVLIFFLLLLIWIKPSNKFLIIFCVLLMILSKFSLSTIKFEEISGVLIYISLLYILVRLSASR